MKVIYSVQLHRAARASPFPARGGTACGCFPSKIQLGKEGHFFPPSFTVSHLSLTTSEVPFAVSHIDRC